MKSGNLGPNSKTFAVTLQKLAIKITKARSLASEGSLTE